MMCSVINLLTYSCCFREYIFKSICALVPFNLYIIIYATDDNSILGLAILLCHDPYKSLGRSMGTHFRIPGVRTIMT